MNAPASTAVPLPDQAPRMLFVATCAWTCCFAAWTIFSIIGVRIQRDLGLSEAEFGLLVSTPILTGSVSRLFLGIASERYGGRVFTTLTMFLSAAALWLLTWAESYAGFLLAALGVGLAGGVFISGISFVAGWFPARLHGSVFGLFGLGNLGAAITNFGAPLLLVAIGWQQTAQIYAVVLLVVAVLFWLLAADDPATVRRRSGTSSFSLADQLKPLRYLRVWQHYPAFLAAREAAGRPLPRHVQAGAAGRRSPAETTDAPMGAVLPFALRILLARDRTCSRTCSGSCSAQSRAAAMTMTDAVTSSIERVRSNRRGDVTSMVQRSPNSLPE